MKNEAKSGFTLLEMMIGIIILSVLLSISFAKFGYVIEKARTVEAIEQLNIVWRLQMLNKNIYGVCLGNGPVGNFPGLGYIEPVMEYFYNVEVHQSIGAALFVALIFRKGSPSPYHLHIGEDGVISCAVNPGGPPDICTRLNFPFLGA